MDNDPLYILVLILSLMLGCLVMKLIIDLTVSRPMIIFGGLIIASAISAFILFVGRIINERD